MGALSIRLFLGCAIVSSLLAVAILTLAICNRELESKALRTRNEITKMQAELQRGVVSEKYYQSIMQDLGNLPSSKTEVQNLLSRYGVRRSAP